MRIVALDPSTTQTGWATWSEKWGTEVGTVLSQPERKRKKGDPPATLAERDRRLRKLRDEVLRCVGLSFVDVIDLAIIEGPAYSRGDAGTWDRAGLWWLVVGALRDMGVSVALCPSANRCIFATGKGRAEKDEVLAAAVRRYPNVPISNNDEADAVIMLGAALTKLSLPTATVPATHLRALTGIEWPTT